MTDSGLLIVVRDPRREPKYECNVPGCDAVFYDGEMRAWERHVVDCAERNEEAVAMQSLRNRDPGLFDPLSPDYVGDADLLRWIRQNEKAIIDGRLRI